MDWAKIIGQVKAIAAKLEATWDKIPDDKKQQIEEKVKELIEKVFDND